MPGLADQVAIGKTGLVYRREGGTVYRWVPGSRPLEGEWDQLEGQFQDVDVAADGTLLACTVAGDKNIVTAMPISAREERRLGIRAQMALEGMTKVLRLSPEATLFAGSTRQKYLAEREVRNVLQASLR